MAQETAGTIGIPVLKNEVLPYLTDYAKRRERAALYKQKAEQRAAELAAKQASEVDNYVPPAFEISKGGYWQPAIKKRMEQETALALDKMKVARTRAEKAKVSQDLNTIVGELNYAGEKESEKQKQNIEALNKSGYNLDEDALARYYGEQAQTNPDFFRTSHINNIKKWAQSQPDKYISPAAIGTTLLKQYEPISISIRGKKDGEKFTYNPLFEPEKVKDELTGANIYRASKANLIKLEEALAGNAGLREAADAFIKPIATRLQAGSPGMSSTEAYTLATEDFINKALPQGRAKEVYDFSEVRARAGGGGGSKPPIDYTFSSGETSANVPSFTFDGKTTTYRDFKIGQSTDKGWPLGTTNHQSGLRGIPLNKVEDADTTGIIKKNDDGSIVINRSFTYDNPIRRTVWRAKGDIQFSDKNGNPLYLIKKGGIVGNTDAGIVLSSPIKNRISKDVGYEVTARTKNPYSERTPDIEKEIRIWVSDADASSIKGNIKKLQKRAPVEGMDEIGKLTY
jgi:hypothetical protein